MAIRNPHAMAAYYEVRIKNKRGSMDVTPFIAGDVVIENSQDMVARCNFPLENRDSLTDLLSRYSNVEIFGGSADPNNRKLLFRGVIRSINLNFREDGRVFAVVQGFGNAYVMAQKGVTISYPSKNCKRAWGQVDEIKLSDIVKNVLNESYYNYAVDLDIKKDMTFTLKSPFVQKGISDWAMLRQLAQLANCQIYEDAGSVDTQHTIVFKDHATIRDENTNIKNDKTENISFRYLPRTPEYEFVEIPYRSNEIITEKLDFVMNVDLNIGSLRIVADFDEANSKSTLIVQQYDSDKDQSFYYELKPEVVASTPVEVQDDLWNRLTYNASDVDWSEIEKYFQKIDLSKSKVAGYEPSDIGMEGAGPLGWVGYELNLTVIGDVRIIPYKYYPLYGIGKYSTNGNKYRYYLRGITHILGEGGFIQQLNFFR